MNTSETLDLMCGMFEAWERESLAAVLQANSGNVERAIEAVLSMEQPSEPAALSPTSAASPALPPTIT